MLETFLFIVYCWLAATVLQCVMMPILVPRLRNYLADGGWAVGRISIWLLMGIALWTCAHRDIPANSLTGITMMFLIMAALSFQRFQAFREEIIDFLRASWKIILIEEFLFAFGLAFFTMVRCYNPQIIGLEKFEDLGFMSSYLRSPTLPAADMWLSGEKINYYSFGHFLGAFMTRLWNIDMVISYNLLLGLLFGLVFMQSFSVVVNLLQSRSGEKISLVPSILGGVLGAMLLCLGGNTQTFWYFLKHGNWQGYWYPDATRFIEYTIHEFPAYSFVVSDLHAHLWGLPIVLLFLTMTIVWYRSFLHEKSPKVFYSFSIVLGVVWGVMGMTNTWDAAIYAVFLVFLGMTLVCWQPRRISSILISAFIIIIVAVGISSSWWIHFKPFSNGVGRVTTGSPWWQLLVLWTGHGVLSGLAIVVAAMSLWHFRKKSNPDGWQKSNFTLILGLGILAWILLIIPEVIYIKDIYAGHVRANTMFKFTYQSVVVFSLVIGWLFGYVLKPSPYHQKVLREESRGALIAIIVVVTATMMVYPFFGYRDFYNGFKEFKGLNGMMWIKEQYPSDYDAILWMRKKIKEQPVILEAVGDSYSSFARVSTYTGLPTVIGWRVHEWLWRGTYDIPGKRSADVQVIYESPLSEDAARLLNEYQVEYIFVGSKEREAYPKMDVEQLKQLGQIVFKSGDTFVVVRAKFGAGT